MIAFVAGPVAALGPDTAVVEVGGIGIDVRCTPDTLSGLRVGEPARLATSLVVREDSLTLYGFVDDDARRTFELLQTAGGVGPRLAQAMLAVHRPDDLRRAVATGDEKALTAVPGIGKKGAQKLLLELRDRLGAPVGTAPRPTAVASREDSWQEQLHAALTGLGWSAREADRGVREVEPEAAARVAEGARPELPVLLRAALRRLGAGRAG
ncbi:Holliday junction branch migration protein RuvA [Streptomyces alkaliphilus]|uniref:Holliday junction branch migration protein RuvA n=1 Tax=Streptomyces alkaliphilus TaxID=1472722 RepID=UPI00117DAC4D|nr:Holliday junction branch migration protein RuvA [Streptomyces alkaliphilus]MQS06935.1 Holliday junction branch migration protein RuvA [Streptomyces alkaliphilus]